LECLKYRQLIKLAIRTGLCEDVLGFQRLRRKLVGASPGALRALLRFMARKVDRRHQGERRALHEGRTTPAMRARNGALDHTFR
jgi:hypothetical protein